MASFATRMNPMATSSTLIAALSPFAPACERKRNKNEEERREKSGDRLVCGAGNISACDWLEDRNRLISWAK